MVDETNLHYCFGNNFLHLLVREVSTSEFAVAKETVVVLSFQLNRFPATPPHPFVDFVQYLIFLTVVSMFGGEEWRKVNAFFCHVDDVANVVGD